MNIDGQKLYQDQLYGAKVLSPLAVAIMDTPEFQRLAGLKQLGFSDVIYRGAHHTRFAHSVGTYFVSRTMMRRIVQNHERFKLEHPGKFVSERFRLVPENSDLPADSVTFQSRWRGVTEVVSASALLHDLGHVPFGHTLEDEFAGLFERHDSLSGPRLFSMLFDPASDLAKVFSNDQKQWLTHIPNEELRQLIYVILSWKDRVEHPPLMFESLVAEAIKNEDDGRRKTRLEELLQWHRLFADQSLFHPFMSDVVGNTICADILDYLARDRINLGMESRKHTRLQRYFTIRPGTLHKPSDGLRLSILVTRIGRGGQRRDVATAVLEVMRERYEMSERVFYHHKKAAASAMLAKLLELTPPNRRPRDDDQIYPAPWEDSDQPSESSGPPHMTHLSDSQLIQYLANQECDQANKALQKRIARGLMYRRNGKIAGMYRTLLVVDEDLVRASKYDLSVFIEDLRGKDRPSSVGRNALEALLAGAASASAGQVIVYCPSEKMQAKEIDVRLEVKAESVLPLRELAARNEFVDLADVDALRRHYEQLWRAYIFVSPDLFEDKTKCLAIVKKFCEEYGIPMEEARKKVRTHRFAQQEEQTRERAADGDAAEESSGDGMAPLAAGTPDTRAWENDEPLVDSRGTLLRVVKQKRLSAKRRDALWNRYLDGETKVGERLRKGSFSEEDWIELNDEFEREQKAPELFKK